MKRMFIVLLAFICLCKGQAQQYTGTTGLIHVPTAELNDEGTARIGVHYLNSHLTPDTKVFYDEGKKYGSVSCYLSLTPFKWVELGYNVTLLHQVHHRAADDASVIYDGNGFREKDQYFSVKIQPLCESEDGWWPSISVGGNDFLDSHSGVSGNDGAELYFGNLYLSMSKHLAVKGNVFGAHLSYRKFRRDYNSKWNGLVGGVTFHPAFHNNLRFIAEWTGNEVNIGADCLLWNHWLAQVSLLDGKYFGAGLCYQLNLFGNKR